MTQELTQITKKIKSKLCLSELSFGLIVGFFIAIAAVTNVGKANPAFPLEFGTLFLFVSMAVAIEHGLIGIVSAAIGNIIGISLFILILIGKEVNTANILLISRAYLEAFLFALSIAIVFYLAAKSLFLIVKHYTKQKSQTN